MRIFNRVVLLMLLGVASLSVTAEQAEYYVCPMHPHYRTHGPGTCPICGMRLTPVAGGDDSMSEGALDLSDEERDGKRMITLSPETIQHMGVRTERVRRVPFGAVIRSYGLVTENVRNSYAITGRVAGWIEALHITAQGDEVRAGDLLFELYSPDLISAQRDYVVALQSQTQSRVESSEKRLRSLGMSLAAIEHIRRERQYFERTPFYSEADGVVRQLNVRLGAYIEPGMPLATIQDYHSVWIEVSVAEKDLQFLAKDSLATVTFPNLGNQNRTAQVDYIYPTINENSRTGQLRLVLDNRDGVLKPGAYADVVFESNVDERVSVPSEAILKSSAGDFVVLSLGEGRFQSRPVQTGIRDRERTEIRRGVSVGDEVVVSSQFLIDSESTLRETFRKMQPVDAPMAADRLPEVNPGEGVHGSH